MADPLPAAVLSILYILLVLEQESEQFVLWSADHRFHSQKRGR